MSILERGRSGMALFSSPVSPYSHCARVVLAAKGINVEIIDVDDNKPPEDLIDLNPYHSTPTLIDRDLVLYDPEVIGEYLDERYPHPPLMAVDPMSRARARLALFRIRHDWYTLVDDLDKGTTQRAEKARKMLKESIIKSNDAFAAGAFFLSDELSLVDCAIAPVLWRLKSWRIDLPRQAQAVKDYSERVFAMESFRNSLSAEESELGF